MTPVHWREAEGKQGGEVQLGGQVIIQVEEFKYLESVIQSSQGSDVDVTHINDLAAL